VRSARVLGRPKLVAVPEIAIDVLAGVTSSGDLVDQFLILDP